MHTRGKQTVFRIYCVLLCLSIVLAGLCLIAQCLLIYRSGEHPFTPEAVASAFSQIALPVYFCGGMVLLGILLRPVLPHPVQKPKKNYDLILRRLQQTTDLALCPESLRKNVEALHAQCRLVQSLGWIILAVGSLIFLQYGANPAHFHQTEISDSMIRAMYWLIPSMLAPFGYGIFSAYFHINSKTTEISLLRTAPPEARCAAPAAVDAPGKAALLRWGILAAAVSLLLVGFFMGGAVDVLTKAVNICTECIGLG